MVNMRRNVHNECFMTFPDYASPTIPRNWQLIKPQRPIVTETKVLSFRQKSLDFAWRLEPATPRAWDEHFTQRPKNKIILALWSLTLPLSTQNQWSLNSYIFVFTSEVVINKTYNVF